MSEAREVHSVDEFDLQRYLGLWFEIGRLPLRYQDLNSSNVTAHYSLEEGGAVQVDNRCLDDDGEPTQALGQATPVEGEVGQLKVTFLPTFLRWLPFTEGDYWVLKLDPGYSVALVGTPDHKHLWLLAREPELDQATTDEYLVAATAAGFDLGEWIVTPQTGARVTDEQLAEAD